MLSDLGSWPGLKAELEEFVQEMADHRKDLFDSWCKDNLEQIESEELSLQTGEQVVFFEAGKRMKARTQPGHRFRDDPDEMDDRIFCPQVSYNPRLVGLLKEVRMLTVLGFSVPAKILETADLAKKFARQARDLEQIATFHNTIGGRMIVSQRPMMLEAALGLAQLVKEQTGMTWDKVDQVQRYVTKLQGQVDLLARQNNLLAGIHQQVKAKVLELMDTDLLRQQDRWKAGLKEIRQIVTSVEVQHGFSDLKTWKNHWDHQLYKALEHQYQVGLEALSEHLPDIEVEVVYRQQVLQFRPPMEEIRMKYYSQLKRFLAIPNNFRGVSDAGGPASGALDAGRGSLIFPRIVERNSHR